MQSQLQKSNPEVTVTWITVARSELERYGASCLIWCSWRNASLAILMIWASIVKEASRITPRLMMGGVGVNGTLSSVSSWQSSLSLLFPSHRTFVLEGCISCKEL